MQSLFNYQLSSPGKVMIVIAGLIALIGTWLLIKSFIPTPTKQSKKTIKSFVSTKSNAQDVASDALSDVGKYFSKRLAKHIHMTPIERSEMERALQINKEGGTPEEHKAYNIVMGLFFGFIGAMFFIAGMIINSTISKLCGVAGIVVGIVVYIYLKKSLMQKQKKAVLGIEAELPRFVSFIVIASRTRNSGILAMLEHYTPEDEVFREELSKTIADAKTSNFDSAMNRWDQRINSDRLRMVINGLKGANNGDNMDIYFAMLEKDFTAYEISLLKQNVKTIPNRMRLPKMLMYTSVFVALFFPIAMQVVESFKTIFSA